MKHESIWIYVLKGPICYKSAIYFRDFPGGPVVKNLPYNAGDMGSISGWGSKFPRAETARWNYRACALQQSPRGSQLRPQAAK